MVTGCRNVWSPPLSHLLAAPAAGLPHCTIQMLYYSTVGRPRLDWIMVHLFAARWHRLAHLTSLSQREALNQLEIRWAAPSPWMADQSHVTLSWWADWLWYLLHVDLHVMLLLLLLDDDVDSWRLCCWRLMLKRCCVMFHKLGGVYDLELLETAVLLWLLSSTLLSEEIHIIFSIRLQPSATNIIIFSKHVNCRHEIYVTFLGVLLELVIDAW